MAVEEAMLATKDHSRGKNLVEKMATWQAQCMVNMMRLVKAETKWEAKYNDKEKVSS